MSQNKIDQTGCGKSRQQLQKTKTQDSKNLSMRVKLNQMSLFPMTKLITFLRRDPKVKFSRTSLRNEFLYECAPYLPLVYQNEVLDLIDNKEIKNYDEFENKLDNIRKRLNNFVIKEKRKYPL